ncbi:hypothetical protein MMC13_005343 [Lambiella insularis]|nr:hypothetical protein [Lambiella insularis]
MTDTQLILNPATSGQHLLTSAHAHPPYNIDQNAWGCLDFAAGQTKYYTDDSEHGRTANTAAFKVIGSNGMDSCMGVAIVSKTHAVVVHFSPHWPGNSDHFSTFVASRAAGLRGSRAWMVMPTRTEPFARPYVSEASMRDIRQPHDGHATYGAVGEGSVVVDARHLRPVLPDPSLVATRPAAEVEVTVALVTSNELVVKVEAIVLEPWVMYTTVVSGMRVLVGTTLVSVVKEVVDCGVVVVTAEVIDVVAVDGDDTAEVAESCVDNSVNVEAGVEVVVLGLASVFDGVVVEGRNVDECIVDVGVDVGVVVVEISVVVETSVVEAAVALADGDDADADADAPVPNCTVCRLCRSNSAAEANEDTASSAANQRATSRERYMVSPNGTDVAAKSVLEYLTFLESGLKAAISEKQMGRGRTNVLSAKEYSVIKKMKIGETMNNELAP